MSVWFEGDHEIDCTIRQVKQAFENQGEFFVRVVSLMPGLTTVELVEQGTDFVTIKTNEGLMKRTHIHRQVDADRVIVEFDEEYEAGSQVTTKSHFSEEFTTGASGVTHRLVMSNVEAPGFLGFFYRTFGSSKTGNAFLAANKAYLEKRND